VLSINVEVFLH